VARELAATTAEEVAACARAVQTDALYLLPPHVPLRPLVGAESAIGLAEPVAGRAYRHADAPIDASRMVASHVGVTWQPLGRAPATVRFRDLAVAVRHDDGGLILVGRDGAEVALEPTLWRQGASLVDYVTRELPPSLIIAGGARPASQIPRPSTTRLRRARATLARHWPIPVIAVVGLLALFRPETYGVSLIASGLFVFSLMRSRRS
jgi:hypothetical protein